MPFKGWKGLVLDTSPEGLQRRTSLDVTETPIGLLSASNFDVMCSVCGDTRGDIVYHMTWEEPYGLKMICSGCNSCSRRTAEARRDVCKPGQNDSTDTGTVSSMRPSKSSATTSSH
jgi:hypothetical protein